MNRELKEIMKIMARIGFKPKTRSKKIILYHIPRKHVEGDMVVAFGLDETGSTQIVAGGVPIPNSKINDISHMMADINASLEFGYLVLSREEKVSSVLFRHTMVGHNNNNLDEIFERVRNESDSAFKYISEALTQPAINIHVTAGNA